MKSDSHKNYHSTESAIKTIAQVWPSQTLSSSADASFSLDDAMEHFGYGKFQLMIAAFGGFILMADAMEMMLLSLLSPALACDWGITNLQQASITSCVFGGMAISSGFWGRFCDRHGRRKGLMIMSLATFVFAMASSLAPNYYVFVVFRTLTGMGIGGMPQSTTYFSEFLPVKHRALCILIFYTFWSLGSIFEAGVALVVMEPLGWRWLICISTFPLLAAAGLCWFVPETPRFLITLNRPSEACNTLKLIARVNGRSMLPGKLIQPLVQNETDEKSGRLRDLFSKKMALTTILVWSIWFVSIFCYYGLILLTTVIFQEDKSGSNSTKTLCKKLKHEDYLDIAYAAFSELPGLFICALMFQFLSRKITMSVQFGVFGISIVSLLFHLNRSWTNVFIYGARAAINGVFSGVFIYTPEVYPTTIRAIGIGTASGVGRMGALITPYFAEVVSRHFSIDVSVIIYGGAGFLAATASLFLPIETRNRRLRDRLCEEEIDQNP